MSEERSVLIIDDRRVFELFTQADVSNTKGVAGTGLDLSISKTNVEHQKGGINFTSGLNKGTCFYFTYLITS